mmetsp:Transcript_14125/g.38380  ORF Transcript_14125/g.38380 Transcript_14125/m.38380 type:complete len:240 (+) Transcript_14125:350-1069(+)
MLALHSPKTHPLLSRHGSLSDLHGGPMRQMFAREASAQLVRLPHERHPLLLGLMSAFEPLDEVRRVWDLGAEEDAELGGKQRLRRLPAAVADHVSRDLRQVGRHHAFGGAYGHLRAARDVEELAGMTIRLDLTHDAPSDHLGLVPPPQLRDGLPRRRGAHEQRLDVGRGHRGGVGLRPVRRCNGRAGVLIDFEIEALVALDEDVVGPIARVCLDDCKVSHTAARQRPPHRKLILQFRPQ